MRDHELELIAALVEGRLEDESEARALIGSSPELQAEYEAQKTAYEALSALGTASLTDGERAALRRDLWTEMRSPEAATPSRSPWYYRWVPALAGMFVVVGLVAVLSNAGSDDAGDEGVAQLSAETTTADRSDTDAAGGEATDTGADSGEDEVMEESETTSEATEDAPPLSPAGVDFYSAQASMLRSGALEETAQDEAQSPEVAAAPCLEAANLAGYVPLTILTAPIESDRFDVESLPVPSQTNPVIVAIPEGADLTSAVVAFVDQDDCQLIHLDE